MSVAVAVRERPIILSGPMVRAVLDGTKTQTRRALKVQPWLIDPVGVPDIINGGLLQRWACSDGRKDYTIACPYGPLGAQLWVREAWSAPDACECSETCHTPGHVYYHANDDGYMNARHNRKRPSIHMPRWASRLTLEITGVRVERVQEISYADVIAEGCPNVTTLATPDDHDWYRNLWDSLNAKRGYPWESNPWVWVLEFRAVLASVAGEEAQT